MIDSNLKKNLLIWSKIGLRAAFGLSLIELKKKYKNFFVVSADVSTSAGLDRYRKTHSQSYVETGITEQSMMGIASGIASENLPVITTTFAPFQTSRCNEQIKVNLGYMKSNVCMVGIASGVSLGMLGYTHCAIEDVGVLRSIPNIKIFSPADCFELYKILENFLQNPSPTYLRLTGNRNSPTLYNETLNFNIDKPTVFLDEGDITLITTGSILKNILLAVEDLKKKNFKCNILHYHNIKPFNKKILFDYINKSKIMFSFEEHNSIGGLGSAISEAMSEIENSPKLVKVGIPDTYDHSGTYDDLLKKFDLDENGISKIIVENLKNI